jgi:hypothetical protein
MKNALDQQSSWKGINAPPADSKATTNNETQAQMQAGFSSMKSPNDLVPQEESQQSEDGSPSDLSSTKRARSPTQEVDDDGVDEAAPLTKKPATMAVPAPPSEDPTKTTVESKKSRSTRSGAGKAATRTGKGPKLPLAAPSPMLPQFKPAGEYATQLLLQRRRELGNYPVVPLQPHVIGGLRDQIEKYKQCNCKRSNCLKLYCVSLLYLLCFLSCYVMDCTDLNTSSWHNTPHRTVFKWPFTVRHCASATIAKILSTTQKSAIMPSSTSFTRIILRFVLVWRERTRVVRLAARPAWH